MKHNNPLLSHVRRHQRMPVIFRSAAVSPSRPQTGVAPAVPLVQATLPRPEAVLPAETPVQTPAPEVVRQRPPQTKPDVPAGAPQPVQRQAETATPATPASQPSQPASTEEKPEPGWRRLQAIAQAHQDKHGIESPEPPAKQPAATQQTAEKIPPTPKPPKPSPRAAKILGRKESPPRNPPPEEKKRAEITFVPSDKEQPQAPKPLQVEQAQTLEVGASPEQTQPPAPIQREVETAPKKTESASTPAVESRETKEQPAVEPAVQPVEPTDIPDTIVSAPPQRPAEETAASPSEPVAQTAEQQPVEPLPSAAPEPIIQRQPIDEPEQEGPTPPAIETPPIQQQPPRRSELETTTISPSPFPDQKGETPLVQRQPSPPEPAAGDQHETADASHDASQPAQNMPLEAVWPVQRLQNQPASRVGLDPVPTIPAVQRDRDAESRIRQSLETVASGRKSDSGIELVLPKRPRPVPRQKKSSPPVRKPSPKQPETTKPQAVVQRQTAEPDEIETEIGPLPGDLWQLLGQTPPVKDATPVERPDVETAVKEAEGVGYSADQVVGVTAAPKTTPAVQRQLSDESSHQGFNSEAVQKGEAVTSPIQRSRIDAGSTSIRTESEGEVDPDTAGKEDGGQPDIEELARQVYQRIKRYLAVERERGRGRF